MDKRKAWTRTELKERTRKGLAIVERETRGTRAAGGFGGRSFLERAVAACVEGEKQHRGFGRRLVGDIGKRAPLLITAEAMVLGFVVRGSEGRGRRPTWTEAAETREDCALAYAIHECLPKLALRELRALGWAEFDYVLDIAGVTL